MFPAITATCTAPTVASDAVKESGTLVGAKTVEKAFAAFAVAAVDAEWAATTEVASTRPAQGGRHRAGSARRRRRRSGRDRVTGPTAQQLVDEQRSMHGPASRAAAGRRGTKESADHRHHDADFRAPSIAAPGDHRRRVGVAAGRRRPPSVDTTR